MRRDKRTEQYACIFVQDEVTRLRQYLSSQPGPSLTDPISLPPALVSVLLPHINHSKHKDINGSAGTTVTTALTQRVRLLQEENDELYELLKFGETGKLKEEVRGLRRVVERLEGALKGVSCFRAFHAISDSQI
jgi:hypothetical protein